MVVRLTPLAALAALVLGIVGSAPAADRAFPRATIYSIQPDGHGLRRIARPDPPVTYLVQSPAGNRMLFGRWESDRRGLYVSELSGANAVRITPEPGPTESFGPAVFSADGTKVAFGIWKPSGPRTILTALYVVDVDGTGLRRIADEGDSPSWSPGGSRLAYVRGGRIHVVDVATVRDTTIARGSRPVWAPRGRRIAYLGYKSGHGVPCFVDADGSRRRCGSGFTVLYGIVWSPDATRVAFTRAPEGWLGVYTPEGRLVRRFADQRNRPRPHAWSPDGRQLVYSYSNPFTELPQLYVRRAAGRSIPRRLTNIVRDPALGWRFTDVRWPGRITFVGFE